MQKDDTFMAVDEVRREVRSIQDDVSKIKVALVSHFPDENCHDTLVHMGFYETEDAFKEFSEKLEDAAYKQTNSI